MTTENKGSPTIQENTKEKPLEEKEKKILPFFLHACVDFLGVSFSVIIQARKLKRRPKFSLLLSLLRQLIR